MEIGTVTADGMLRARMRGEVVAEVPVRALADEAPVYEKPTARPPWLDDLEAFDPRSLSPPTEPEPALLSLLASPTIASQGMGVSPVRSAGRDQHSGPARLRRGRAPDQGDAEGASR